MRQNTTQSPSRQEELELLDSLLCGDEDAWRRFHAHAVALRDWQPGEVNLTFHVSPYVQTLEIGGVVVLNLGQDAFENNSEKHHRHQTLGKGKHKMTGSSCQTVGPKSQAENQGQAEKIVPVPPDPAWRQATCFTNPHQDKEKSQPREQSSAPGDIFPGALQGKAV